MNIFLSYSSYDNEKAKHVSSYLRNYNIGNIIDHESYVKNNNFIDDLRYNIHASDYVILFLSTNFLNSKYSMLELSESLNELRMRKIKIIPIVIEKCSIPSDLLEFEIIDLSKSFDKGIKKLSEKLTIQKKIDFEQLDPLTYEKIVTLFLKEYGFQILQSNDNHDFGVDYICEYFAKNPFGDKVKETWMIEVKFYKSERFSINNINKLYSYMKNNFSVNSKLLLITNSILNSAAIEYLQRIQYENENQITVIDGPTFERLIYRKKRLLKRIEEVINASN